MGIAGIAGDSLILLLWEIIFFSIGNGTEVFICDSICARP